MIKLKPIVENNLSPTSLEDQPRKLTKEEKKSLAELVKNYNKYGKILQEYNEIVNIADTLKKIAEYAEVYAVNESDDWMQGGVVKRHFTEIRKHAESFKKMAKDVYEKNNEMLANYQDMGKKLETYFEISDV
jgi:coenzyme F420-reducing hydrogenase alpha subunit